MKSVIETFITVLLASIAIIICSQFIGVQIQTNNAKDLHTTYISIIESSGFDEDVITQCKQDVSDKGYELTVNNTSSVKKRCSSCKKELSDSALTCDSCHMDAEYYADQKCEVSLKYTIKISIIQIEKEGIIHGYAR